MSLDWTSLPYAKTAVIWPPNPRPFPTRPAMSDEKTLEQLIHFVTELLPMAGAGVLPSQEFGAGSPFRYDQEMNPNVKRARDNALIAGLAAIEAVADRMARQFEVAPATGGEE